MFSCCVPGAFNTAYTYNTDGLLTNVTSTNSTSTVYTYDSYDRISSETLNAPDSKSLVRSYTYSSYGNGTGISGTMSVSSENDMGLPTSVSTTSASREYYYDVYGRQGERIVSIPNGIMNYDLRIKKFIY